ncbi:MAG: 1-acyl-sn-glycerol-3-phosphate acyltransferase, partial [Alphaproteobacteria bacterium]|nr:1-acyl-sn-glycerol-3-phosphate acyltransferase [Alphaproteobacteria bacterium]
MQKLRGILILLLFVITALLLIPVQSAALALKLKGRKTIPNAYSRFLCRLFGVRLRVLGRPVQDKGVLMVANHTSYLDIIALGASARVSFVAKSEVNTWPFFGVMARLYETVFVERARRTQAGVARDQLRQRLDEGDALVLFPEGTSNDGNRVLPFKSALMAAAESQLQWADNELPHFVPVQPVSLAYTGFQGMPMGRENRPLFRSEEH